MRAEHSGRTWATVVIATAVALGLLVAAAVAAHPAAMEPAWLTPLAFTASFLPVGLFLIRHRPRAGLSLLVWAVGALSAVASAGLMGPSAGLPGWLAQWTWWPPVGLLPLVLLTFPESAPPGSRRRRAVTLLAWNAALATVLLAVAPLVGDQNALTLPHAAEPAARPLYVAAVLCVLATGAGFVAAAAALVRAARRAESAQRSQYLCLVPAAVLAVAGLPLEAANVTAALVPAILALPIGIGVAVVQFNYDDLGFRVARRFLRTVLLAVTVAAFAAVLFVVGSLVIDPMVPFAACFVVAVLAAALDPLRRHLDAAADRWLFGHRSDPYRVLSILGDRMQASSDPAQALQNATDSIVSTLTVPYARIVIEHAAGRTVLTESGTPTVAAPVPFPLSLPDRVLGNLEVAPRHAKVSFEAREGDLLAQIARQAAYAVQALRLTADLRAAREVLVFAREEERLRLRRDLHDGLGPVLAGARMQLAAVQRITPAGQPAERLRNVLDQLGVAGATVRELIEGLRPAGLDLGLKPALEQAAFGVLAGVDYTVEIPENMPALPPAVDVAAFFIASEAMHNVARHAHATTCEVKVDVDADALTLDIRDDGRGLGPQPRPGVGLESMKARADELGGTVDVIDAEPGVRIHARLPLAEPAARRAHAPLEDRWH